VPTASLPERPALDKVRRHARELQRAARAGDPDALARIRDHHPGPVPDAAALRRSDAQLVVAREYGFASWTRLRRYLDAVAEHGWNSALGATPVVDPAAEFWRLACLTYTDEDGPERWARARQVLAEHPDLTRDDIWAAAAAARPDDVRRLLAQRPDRARERGGPFGWRPLVYLSYSRAHAGVPADAVLSVAHQLLAAGGDPNDGYLWDGRPYAFTLLTGVLGSGELGPQRQPAHPRWRALARVLLEAGADPNDAQGLYNRMFGAGNEHLELLFEFGLGSGDGGPWRARIGDLGGSPEDLLRTQLRWAVEHDQFARVRLLAEHGVDVRSPYVDGGPAWRPGDGRTPVELAIRSGNARIADYLVARGATPPEPDPVNDLIAAAMRADAAAVRRIRDAHPGAVEEARRARPGLMVWAAAQAPAAAVDLLAGLGFDVNALGRADAPVEQPWETALHHSAGEGDADLTRRLLALGADPTIRDARFDATPLDWAHHFGHRSTIEVLTRLTP
jgi:ankyrin repeat protein